MKPTTMQESHRKTTTPPPHLCVYCLKPLDDLQVAIMGDPATGVGVGFSHSNCQRIAERLATQALAKTA